MRFGDTLAGQAVRVGVTVLMIGSMASAYGAVVTLHNGDTITGEIGQLNEDTLTFSSSVFGEVKIPWKNVATLVSEKDVRVQLHNGTQLKGKIALDDANTVVVRSINQGEVAATTLPRQEMVALNPPVADPNMKYSGRLDLGGAFNRGNSTDDDLNVDGEFVARTPDQRYTVELELNEAKTGKVSTISNRRLLGQYDHFLSNKNYLLFKIKGENDQFADLTLRTTLGTGYGHQFSDSNIVKLSGELGLNFVHENYVNSPNASFYTVSVGMKYDRKLFNEKLIYFQNVSIESGFENMNNTLLRNRLGFRVPIAYGVNVSTQLNVDYNHRPAVGKKKTDTSVLVNVGYGF